MKRFVCAILSLCLLLCCPLTFCEAEEPEVITVQQWLDTKGEAQGILVVCIEEVINPVLALVRDDTASVNLFGVTIDGEFSDFFTPGIQAGDVLLLKNPRYNEYEGTIEMADTVLLQKLSSLRLYITSLMPEAE